MARPRPPMHISPSTPMGHSLPKSSKRKIRVLSIGEPIGSAASSRQFCNSSDVTRQMVDQIVVSVGPYIFHTARLCVTNLAASDLYRGSPPTRTVICGFPRHPLNNISRHVDGVAWTYVTS